jgi:hypothetical protein
MCSGKNKPRMRRLYPFVLCIFLIQSCIPLRIAPNISDYKTVKGTRFKKGLPQKNAFVFEDPKEAGEFYDYVNTKFDLQDYYADVEVPFQVGEKQYFFSFYEVEKKGRAINLVPILLDVTINATLGNDEFETYTATDENTLLRNGNYYIAIEAYSAVDKDCLSYEYTDRDGVLVYLRNLKEEYLTSHNLHEVVFKNK